MRRSPVRREAPPEETLDPTTKKGLIAAGVLVVIAAGIWIVVKNKRDAEDAAVKARQDEIANFLKTQKGRDPKNKADLQAGIVDIDQHTTVWQETSIDSDIRRMRSQFTGWIADIDARETFVEAFNRIKGVVDAAASKTSDDLMKARQELTDLEQTDSSRYDPSYPQQIKDMKNKIDHVVIGKLREEAKEYAAASGTTPRQGLAKYAAAEDYIRKAMLDAKQAKSADEEPFREIYKGLLAESDEYAKRVINKDFIESIPWKDLLSGEMASKWSKTTTVPGFACRIENGILTVSPPEPGSKQLGVCGILDQKNDNLRNLMLDMEFAVDGVATMYVHVSPPPQNPDPRQSETYELSSREGGLKPNEKYSLVASFIGSDLAIWFPQNDEIQRWENSPTWTRLRRGGIAFLIPEGTRLRVTRMRIRELR